MARVEQLARSDRSTGQQNPTLRYSRSRITPTSRRWGCPSRNFLTFGAFVFMLGLALWSPAYATDQRPLQPVSVSVRCVDLAANPYGPQGTSLGFEMHFSRNVQRDDDYGTPLFEITGQDDSDFTWDAMGGPAGSLGDMYRIWRWSATPKVPTPEGSRSGVVSDVNGLVITVPAGGWHDGAGNTNTASANSLHRAHNWKVSVADASATEGTDGTIDFEVTLNARDDCETVTVDWTTADGTATAEEDYAAASGTLTFGPGETSKTVRVALLDTTVVDGSETFSVQLSNAPGITLDDAEAIGTISRCESGQCAGDREADCYRDCPRGRDADGIGIGHCGR